MRRTTAILASIALSFFTGCAVDVASGSTLGSGGGGGGGTPTGTTTGSGTGSTTSVGTGGDPDASWCSPPAEAAAPTGSGFAASWVTTIGEAPAEWVLGPFGLASDPAGNAVVVGSYWDTFNLGTGTTLSSPGEYGGYAAGISSAGEPQWLADVTDLPDRVVADSNVWVSSTISSFTLTRFSLSGQPVATWPVHPYGLPAIASAGAGGLWVANDFVGGPFAYGSGSIPMGAELDVALLRFDAGGAVVAARSLGAMLWPTPGPGFQYVQMGDIAPTPDGGVLALVDITTEAGEDALALLRLDPSGNLLWRRSLPSGNHDTHPRIYADSQGNALITLRQASYGPTDIGCGPAFNAAMEYVSADGTPRWWRNVDGASLGGAGFDASGNVIVAGTYVAALDLGGGALPWVEGKGERMFLLKLSPTGAHLASRSFGDGPDGSSAQALFSAVTPAGDVLVAGVYSGAADLGLSAGALPVAATRNAFVARYTP